MARAPHPNRFLSSLQPADWEQLRPHLKARELVHGSVLYETGAPIDVVYFPHSGVISLVVDLTDGQTIEAAMIGRDSLAGATSALDGQISLNKAIVQVPGNASVLGVAVLRNV